jgi:hypothetical protein
LEHEAAPEWLTAEVLFQLQQMSMVFGLRLNRTSSASDAARLLGV